MPVELGKRGCSYVTRIAYGTPKTIGVTFRAT